MAFDISNVWRNVEAVKDRLAGDSIATISTHQAQDAVNVVSAELQIPDDDARKVVAAMTYVEAQNRGTVPQEVWDRLPPEMRAVLKYGPEDLKWNQLITKIKTFGTPVVILTSVVAAIGLGLGAPIAIAGGLGALVWYLNGLANDWNDTFHWGPQMQQQTAVELYKEANKLDEIGVTDYGQFTLEQVQGILEAFLKGGKDRILNPISAYSMALNENNLISALKEIITALNAEGIVPTKKQVLAVLAGWVKGPRESLPPVPTTAAGIAAEVGAAAAGGTTYETKPRVTTYSQTKQKLFLGTIFGGAIAEEKGFMRVVDDAITDEADLLNDAKINLATWLATLPGKLTYKIEVKLNPVDDQNVQKIGTWAVLQVYINNQYNKAIFLDEILLGPMDPTVYYPETYRTTSLAVELGQMFKGGQIAIEPQLGGTFRIIDKQGNVIANIFGDEGEAVTPAAPAAGAAAGGVGPRAPAPAPVAPTWPYPAVTPGAMQNFTPEFSSAKYGYAMYIRAYGGIYWEGKIVATNAKPEDYDSFVRRTEAHNLSTIERPAKQSLSAELEDLLFTFNFFKGSAAGVGAGKPAQTTVVPATPATAYPRQVTVGVDTLFVRSQPNKNAPLAGSERLYRGDVFQVAGFVQGEAVDGESRWWISSKGNYVWVGGTIEKP